MPRALVSVTDKSNLGELRPLVKLGWEFISTGGTAKELEKLGIPVVPIEQVTGFPEMMDGRLKTLHPKIEGGILAVRSNPEHMRVAKEHGIEMIDLVIVNLYDFEGNPGIEQIDIGGPTMIRAAAKNFESVVVLVKTNLYMPFVREIVEENGISLHGRRFYAHLAFEHSAHYESRIAAWSGWRLSTAEETLAVGKKSH